MLNVCYHVSRVLVGTVVAVCSESVIVGCSG